jgi:hypothetical protein
MEKEIAENAKVNPKKFWQYANSKRKTKSGIGEITQRMCLGSFSLSVVFQSESIFFTISV